MALRNHLFRKGSANSANYLFPAESTGEEWKSAEILWSSGEEKFDPGGSFLPAVTKSFVTKPRFRRIDRTFPCFPDSQASEPGLIAEGVTYDSTLLPLRNHLCRKGSANSAVDPFPAESTGEEWKSAEILWSSGEEKFDPGGCFLPVITKRVGSRGCFCLS